MVTNKIWQQHSIQNLVEINAFSMSSYALEMYIFSHPTGPRTFMTFSDFNKAYTLSGFPASAALTSWVIFSESLLWNTFQHLFGEDSQQLPANIQWLKDWSVLIWITYTSHLLGLWYETEQVPAGEVPGLFWESWTVCRHSLKAVRMPVGRDDW